MATNNAINLNQLKQSVFNMKNYVDSKVPDSNRYEFIEEIVLSCNQDNIADKVTNSNGKEFVYYNFSNVITNELPNKSYIKINAKINNTELTYANKYVDDIYIPSFNISTEKYTNLESYAFYTDNDTSDVSKRISVGMISLNSKRDTTNNTYVYEKNSICLYYTNETLLFENGITITLQFYSENSNYVGYIYNYPYNLLNGEGINSLQSSSSNAKGAYSMAFGESNSCSGNNNILLGAYNHIYDTSMSVTIGNLNKLYKKSIAIGKSNIIKNFFSIAIGNGLTVDGYNRSTAGNMILGQGGTLAKDSLFTISTALNNANAAGQILSETVRYPFEVKSDNKVYLRGSDVILETDNEPTAENHLITKKYVDDKVAGIVDSAPETLDTLKELSTALGDDPNFATTVATNIGNKVDKVDGKGLSTNDLTDELKTNYDAAYTYSQATHSYNDLTDKPEIPSIDGLATTEYVDNKVTKLPKVLGTLSDYVTLNDNGIFYDFNLDLLQKDKTYSLINDISESPNGGSICNLFIGGVQKGRIPLDTICTYITIGIESSNNTLYYNDIISSCKINLDSGERENVDLYSLSNKAARSEVLTLTNTTEYTPTADYHPATKKYVDDVIASASSSSDTATDDEVKSAINDILGGDYVE